MEPIMRRGRLTHVERLPASRLGNPRFRLTLDERETFLTQTDGAVGYAVDNFRVGRKVVLTLTRAGRVSDMTYEDGKRP